MTTEAAAKRNTQKLQRAIVDGLEDVKAQDIQVFDTEHLSSLFERVIVASGTSNRQTKALAASVRDGVREAGFPKPRIEGEANGEWIIVDCGQAVVHIMQPTFRAYYHLEELWGEKPVRLKFGASKPVVATVLARQPAAGKPAAKKANYGKPAPRATDTAKPTTTHAARPAPSRAKPRTAQTTTAKPATVKSTMAKLKPATAKVKTVVVPKSAGKKPSAAKRGAAPAKVTAPRKPSPRKA